MENATDDPILAVGLGNPGYEYADTRHNVGFMVVDELSARLHCMWKPGKGEYVFCRKTIHGKSVVLMKPLTYMNNSGTAVLDVLERFPTAISNIIAIVDDFALGLGTIRVLPKGRDGGHNGLRSIIYHLQSTEFPRIRCGIRSEDMEGRGGLSDFVLSPFGSDQRVRVNAMIAKAADAFEEFVRSGIERTMTRYNGKDTPDQ